ncbi:3'-5' exonuclease [Subtercola sp. RTI3]|uniref:3'-5' exonuclease n=1 Tax=Subtercola sp. RTI3 TaxID=3048639 RepID=UPI002B22775A|nr:3'-5' exonuclease [Subtercola sp. RTI3]MEA9986069.1 3'-5' exonuclease [Subtercola sp. RTI3]
MPYIVMTPSVNKLEPAVKKKAFAFLEKLGTSDTTPGLHIEPLHNVADPRVRTGRVDDAYRAVLFKVQGSGDDAHYVFIGIWHHDEAIAIAQKTRLTINPVNGVAELIRETTPTDNFGSAPQPATVSARAGETSASPTTDNFARPSATNTDTIGGTTAGSTESPAGPLLPALGYTLDALVEELGIDPRIAEAALAAHTPEALDEVAERAADRALWQALAILELKTGLPVERIRGDLALDNYEPETERDETEDDRLIQALKHPAAQISFTIVDDEALTRAIEDGDFAEWRVFLHPEQRKYAERSWNGPFRLSGGAGTGKTVVLLHRARMLAQRNPEARIVLTTYTKNLAEALESDLQRLAPEIRIATALGEPGVYVAGVDALASAVLKYASTDIDNDVEAVLGYRGSEITTRTNAEAWADAFDDATGLDPELRNGTFFTAEYALVVLPNTITTREQYLKVRRPGRGVKLDRARRNAVWDAIETYRRRTRMTGTADFEEASAIAAAHLVRVRIETGSSLADHVLIDEGQDLTPTRWQLLRALANEGADDLFIAEDSHQRIYGHRVILGHYGIKIVGRSQRLTLNYRTTAQNLAYAVGILEGAPFIDLEDVSEDAAGYRSARHGPKPMPLPAATAADEISNAADLITRWLTAENAPAPESIAILVRDGRTRDYVARALNDRKIPVRPIDRGVIKTGQPLVMTMHRAKGTEFANVLLFGLDDKTLPSATAVKFLPETERADALLRERSLLYVAATRARDQLAYSWNGSRSPLLERFVAHEGLSHSESKPNHAG